MKLHPLLCLAVLLSAAPAHAQDFPFVTVTGGKIRGAITSDNGAAFKAIPYARPPIGDLRWREPQPVEPWEGVRDALKFSIACTQLSERWNQRFVETSGEDCLYLNVATPGWPPKSKYPVMFWIHGGSNMAGDADDAGFDERTLIRRGVVLVTVSYRLAALGFLVHPELDSESPHHSSGNYGLLDQIAALHWVQDNIEKFGGDPANVTVFGESAGGYDIGLLMTSPLAKGLFQRAILESGNGVSFGGPRPKTFGTELTQKLASRVKAPEKGTIKFLRTLPAKTILTEMQTATDDDRGGLLAAQDGWVFPEPPAKVFADGRSSPVPILIGSNAQEFPGPEDLAKLRGAIGNFYGSYADRALALYGIAGNGTGKSDPLYGGPGMQSFTDYLFRCAATAQAQDQTASGHASYLYEFEHPVPGSKTQCHACELPFLFGSLPKNVEVSPVDKKLSDQMQSYWVNFARTGDPNGEGLPPWPRYSADAQGYLAFTDTGAIAKSNLRSQYCSLWRDQLRAQIAK